MSNNIRRNFGHVRAVFLTLFASALFLAPAASAATLTIEIVGPPGSSGTVTDGTGAIECSGPPATGKCSASEPLTGQFDLTATPGPGSQFAGWVGPEPEVTTPEDTCYGMTNPCMVWMAGDRTITASFSADSGTGQGPDYTPGGPNSGPKKPLPPQAKAYGRHCKGFSKKHVKGQQGTPFSRCVKAMARTAKNPDLNPRKACKGLTKKHVKGQQGTPFSRCVKAAAQLRKEQS